MGRSPGRSDADPLSLRPLDRFIYLPLQRSQYGRFPTPFSCETSRRYRSSTNATDSFLGSHDSIFGRNDPHHIGCISGIQVWESTRCANRKSFLSALTKSLTFPRHITFELYMLLQCSLCWTWHVNAQAMSLERSLIKMH